MFTRMLNNRNYIFWAGFIYYKLPVYLQMHSQAFYIYWTKSGETKVNLKMSFELNLRPFSHKCNKERKKESFWIKSLYVINNEAETLNDLD